MMKIKRTKIVSMGMKDFRKYLYFIGENLLNKNYIGLLQF